MIDSIRSKDTDHVFSGFYGSYILDFYNNTYCTWAIDGDKSFKEMEFIANSKQWDIAIQKAFLEENVSKSPYYQYIDLYHTPRDESDDDILNNLEKEESIDFFDRTFYSEKNPKFKNISKRKYNKFIFFEDNKWKYFYTDINNQDYKVWEILDIANYENTQWRKNSAEGDTFPWEWRLSKGKNKNIFSYKDNKFLPQKESTERKMIFPQYFKKESWSSYRGSSIGGGFISHLSTKTGGILFFDIKINDKTFFLKEPHSMWNKENILKNNTTYVSDDGAVLENFENYYTYTHPKLKYSLFAHKDVFYSEVYYLFMIKD